MRSPYFMVLIRQVYSLYFLFYQSLSTLALANAGAFLFIYL